MPALLLALIGCVNTAGDALIYTALDYRIDRPRVLGIRVEPPVLVADVPVQLHALLVAPKLAEASAASWSTCGLSSEEPTSVRTLECFAQGDEVVALAEGSLPASYTPPSRLPGGCDDLDTGLSIRACSHKLPLLVESGFVPGQPALLGAVQASWYLEPWPEGTALPRSASGVPRALQIEGSPGPGRELAVRYELGADLRKARFRWYVDAGELLETGETAPQEWEPPVNPGEKGVTATSNRWVLPREPGTYRIFVVFEGKGWSESSVYAGAPDQIWDSAEVSFP